MHLQEGQRIDDAPGPSCGLVMPWYTGNALNAILTWDLAGKTVLEYGGGLSTLWWAARCKRVYTVETDRSWIDTINRSIEQNGARNVSIHHREPWPVDTYAEIPSGCEPDIIIIDGDDPRGNILDMRLTSLAVALKCKRPTTIIVDNWQQESVFVSPQAEALMSPFAGTIYPHDGHRTWKTAIWCLS